MKKLRWLCLILCLILLVGCAGETAEQTPTAAPTATVIPEPTEEPFGTRIDENALTAPLAPAEGATVTLTNKLMTEWLAKPYTLGCGYAYNTGGDIFYPDKVQLQWQAAEKATGYTVRLTTKKDFSDVITFDSTETSHKFGNLLVGTTYYWQVVAHTEAGDSYSAVSSFQTAQTPRYLRINGIRNTRDLGGYVTEDGTQRLKQNMIFRSAQLDGLTKKQVQTMLAEFPIKTDLDLRRPGETATAGVASPLGDGVNYVNISGVAYKAAFRKAEMMKELLIFTKEENYPVQIHCAGGKDRTGTLCFVLEALLGVSKEQCCFDYEATYFSANGERDGSILPQFDEFVKMFDKLKGETYREKAETFCRQCGLTDANMEAIREIMLEDIQK